MNFDDLTTPRAVGDGRFEIDVPDGWQQGRGAFGGLVLAIMTRAAEAVVADAGRPLRSLTAEIVGPVLPGATEIAVETLRAGPAGSTLAARLVQGGEVQAHVVAAFGKPRPTYAAAPSLPRPDMPPWRDLAPLVLGPPNGPVFAQHVEFRAIGPTPFSGDATDVARASGWVRLKAPGRARDAAYVAAMADCWWPALFAQLRAARPLATLTFALERLATLDGLDPDAPLFYRAQILAGADGYAVEQRELWGEDGRLIALNQQTIVVIN